MKYFFLAAAIIVVGVVGVGGAASTAWADAPPAAPSPSGDKVKFKKRTVIDFSDVLIEGELTKPEGAYLVSRKASNFSSLIQLRESYAPELLASHNEL